jgi:hypothetical protein
MKFVLMLAVWFVAAIALGASGALQQLRPPAPQLIIAALTIALLAASRISDTFRQWLQTIDLRAFVALHLTRFIGFYFLLLCRKRELPCDFATTAGWGDVVVAILATILLVSWNAAVTRRVWVVGAWNTLGLLDILFVVASASRHGMADPMSMAALLRLPLSLLPTFLVPLIIASHIFIFSRVWSQRSRR